MIAAALCRIGGRLCESRGRCAVGFPLLIMSRISVRFRSSTRELIVSGAGGDRRMPRLA
jgi:hypothetical protein